MPMLEGAISIDPTTAAVVKTGAAGEVFDVLVAGTAFGTLPATNPPAYAAALGQLAVLARVVAKIVVHVQTHAVVSGSTSTGIPVSTAGTAAAQTGATTAPGTIAGTVA
jgi:hypothetical protein